MPNFCTNFLLRNKLRMFQGISEDQMAAVPLPFDSPKSWTFGGMVFKSQLPSGRSAGSVWWAGATNCFWYFSLPLPLPLTLPPFCFYPLLCVKFTTTEEGRCVCGPIDRSHWKSGVIKNIGVVGKNTHKTLLNMARFLKMPD
jgi:hypothetical protein